MAVTDRFELAVERRCGSFGSVFNLESLPAGRSFGLVDLVNVDCVDALVRAVVMRTELVTCLASSIGASRTV